MCFVLLYNNNNLVCVQHLLFDPYNGGIIFAAGMTPNLCRIIKESTSDHFIFSTFQCSTWRQPSLTRGTSGQLRSSKFPVSAPCNKKNTGQSILNLFFLFIWSGWFWSVASCLAYLYKKLMARGKFGISRRPFCWFLTPNREAKRSKCGGAPSCEKCSSLSLSHQETLNNTKFNSIYLVYNHTVVTLITQPHFFIFFSPVFSVLSLETRILLNTFWGESIMEPRPIANRPYSTHAE